MPRVSKKPRRTGVPNVHGIYPPEGCTIRGMDGEDLQVTTPRTDSQKSLFEGSLLIESDKFDELVTQMVRQSATLKAWFAHRISARGDRAEKKSSSVTYWKRVWAVIEQSAEEWNEQYHQSEDRTERWELGEPTSLAELQARVLFLLYQNVQENPRGDLQRVFGLKWHPYYYEEVGRYLLLHRFLIYLNKHTDKGRRMSIHPPSNTGTRRSEQAALWEQMDGYQIYQMAKRFTRDSAWNPRRNIRSAEVDASETQNSAEDIEYVTFLIAGDEEDQRFEIARSSISEGDGYDQDLGGFLHKLLEWPKGYVSIVGVSLDNGDGNDDTSVDTLDQLRHFMDYSDEPEFQLHTACATQAVDPRPTSQRDYNTHWIFKLEPLLGKLECGELEEAQCLFLLIRRNHRCSREFVQDLMALFAPLEQRTNRRLDELAELIRICDRGSAMDADSALGLRPWLDYLGNEKDQVDARLYFNILEANLANETFASQAIKELVRLFKPDTISWEELRNIKDIFDQVGLDAAYD